ncbi:TonB-dependent receptor plug domain-containing protein [Robertkochia solimangrovi]|uniref:TonB-dependent receptor plug domain-containing protein n=1 Tax=Robertkochia solimangrovi TaxID=2213046 RepID=UPI0011805B69|nr:TonB-dependent receptor plug domain-containing protein [Robertkochia solimangrovi]TRZ41181.1 hypothetical protein DMZ48_18075 [Robertkochia solimangrovi]
MRTVINIVSSALIALLVIGFALPERNTSIEKVYTQTDKPLYLPGETIWFKSYITNAENRISIISEVLHAELISPRGGVIATRSLRIKNGYAYGDFDISEEWAGGKYTLRMYTNWMKNLKEGEFFEKELIIQKIVSPNLLMSLDFNEKAYGKGGHVIANLEIKDLKNSPLGNFVIDFQILVSGALYKTGSLRTLDDGKIKVDFDLPVDLNTTDVVLNVMVPYKGLNESIARSIPVSLDKIDLQFFPESGSTIQGVNNRIAFKAVNEFGKPADVSGEIVDETGEKIVAFQSFHDGMGQFEMTPDTQHYYARILTPFISDSLIALPKSLPYGTKFSVMQSGSVYDIDIFSTDTDEKILKVSDASGIYKTIPVSLSNGRAKLVLPREQLHHGIQKITLLSSQGTGLAERLLFCDNSGFLKIAVDLDKELYQTRDKVKVHIKTTDANNNPVSANLSVGVVNNKLISYADDRQDNILTYLLMSSELKGRIHEPSFYFDAEEPKARKALDMVMLTHGWRKFISNEDKMEDAIYLPENLLRQIGYVIDKTGKRVQAHLVLFEILSQKAYPFETDSNGNFKFTVDNNSEMVLIAYTDDGKDLQIISEGLTQNKGEGSSGGSVESELMGKDTLFKESYFRSPQIRGIQQEVENTGYLRMMMDSDAAALDEVVVVGYGAILKSKTIGGSVVTIDQNELFENGQNISDLLGGRVSGVQIIESSGNPGSTSNIRVRGSSTIYGDSQPLLIIDGVPVDGVNYTRIMTSLEASEIESVGVIKGAMAAALYGSRGSNGVIVVKTKNGYNNTLYMAKEFKRDRFFNYAFKRFRQYGRMSMSESKLFYAPVYDSDIISEERSDFRSTIYWNPVVQTDMNGEVNLEYYNSDEITSFLITTEGIGYNGAVGRNETEYATGRPLNMDFKFPEFMVLGDTLRIPVRINNETKKMLSVRLDTELPAALKFVKGFESSKLKIPANSSVVEELTVVPVETVVDDDFIVKVSGEGYNDVVIRTYDVISPYFPTSAVISGVRNGNYEFEVNNAIAGSIRADLNVYIDLIGDVMDGVESILRMPSGCFEQVSSSTYPNVMILKYLKESGKLNTEIENKAMNYIKKGYQKLAAYETAEAGFEWYGHSPPHEALSAYGLMEFSEMKEVYAGVSDAMLKRTINFLMSRRDGKGGFKQHNGKYGFSGAPEDVNNAYIVYAITESGHNVSLDPEYQHAYDDALKSNDSYKMAMMAMASINIGRSDEADILFDRLRNNINEYGFAELPVKSTITRSYNNSEKIENAAMNVLALSRSGETTDEQLISKGVEYILSNRKNGRFGSTQATSMALKALITYNRDLKQKLIDSGNFLTIEINGQKVLSELKSNKTGKVEIPGLEKYIIAGRQSVNIAFSNPENTFPYSMDVFWDSKIPDSDTGTELELITTLADSIYTVGNSVRMNVNVRNVKENPLPMSTAVIGIPSGTTLQTWQIKELLDKRVADYIEIMDNYLVLYWKEFGPGEVKQVNLDLKAEIGGNYRAPASSVYVYYADELKQWVKGEEIEIVN